MRLEDRTLIATGGARRARQRGVDMTMHGGGATRSAITLRIAGSPILSGSRLLVDRVFRLATE